MTSAPVAAEPIWPGRPLVRIGALVLLLALPPAGHAQEVGSSGGSARGDPYHPAPRDTLDALPYEGWKLYSLYCDRCHGQDANGTSFGPSLVESLNPQGTVPTRETFVALLAVGRPDRGMPAAAALGLDPGRFNEVYAYLHGRSIGAIHGGRPARRTP